MRILQFLHKESKYRIGLIILLTFLVQIPLAGFSASALAGSVNPGENLVMPGGQDNAAPDGLAGTVQNQDDCTETDGEISDEGAHRVRKRERSQTPAANREQTWMTNRNLPGTMKRETILPADQWDLWG